MKDPNWLFSSAAQSAAALVAIVGGFLVSRVIGILAERNAASTRLYGLFGRLEQAEHRHEEVVGELRNHDFQDWFIELEDEVIEAKGSIAAGNLISSHPPEGWTQDDFRSSLEQRLTDYRVAFETLEPSVTRGETFHELCQRLGLEPHIRASRLWEYVFSAIQRGLPRDPTEFDSLLGLQLTSAQTAATNAALEGQRAARRNDLANQRTEATYQLRDLNSQIDQTTAYLGSFVVPPDVWRGFWVLVYFSAVGIVWPLSVMAFEPQSVSPGLRGVTVVLFVSGLGALASYMAGLIRRAQGKTAQAKVYGGSSQSASD